MQLGFQKLNRWQYILLISVDDATYIKTTKGDDILIDTSKDKANMVTAYLKKLKIDDEVLISTHLNADLGDGLDEVSNLDIKIWQVDSNSLSNLRL